jgi:hypothetical protein
VTRAERPSSTSTRCVGGKAPISIAFETSRAAKVRFGIRFSLPVARTFAALLGAPA